MLLATSARISRKLSNGTMSRRLPCIRDKVGGRRKRQALPCGLLCNLYLDHQDSRVTVGEIKHRYLYDQRNQLRGFAEFVGVNGKVSEIRTLRVQNYRQKLIKAGNAPRTINNTLAGMALPWAG